MVFNLNSMTTLDILHSVVLITFLKILDILLLFVPCSTISFERALEVSASNNTPLPIRLSEAKLKFLAFGNRTTENS